MVVVPAQVMLFQLESDPCVNFVSDQTHAAFLVQDGICAANVHVDGGGYNSN